MSKTTTDEIEDKLAEAMTEEQIHEMTEFVAGHYRDFVEVQRRTETPNKQNVYYEDDEVLIIVDDGGLNIQEFADQLGADYQEMYDVMHTASNWFNVDTPDKYPLVIPKLDEFDFGFEPERQAEYERINEEGE